MKKLCLGTYLHILCQAKSSTTKQYVLISELLSSVKDNSYFKDEQFQGRLKAGKNNLVDYDEILTCDKNKLVNKFEKNIIPILNPILHKNVVLAFRDVLSEDDIDDMTNIGYESEGYTKQDIVNKYYFNFSEFLANIYYYCVALVKNIPYKDNIKEINDTYIYKFDGNQKEIEFETTTTKVVSSKIPATTDLKLFNQVFKEVNGLKMLLPNPNDIKIYALDVTNNAFDYQRIQDYITNNIGKYIFSRAQRNNYQLKGAIDSISLNALRAYNKRMSKNPETNHFNEIMLYSFLECVLGAPKIFSKMELQNHSSIYDSISSGVHILSLKKGVLPYNQLIFGATDTIDDLNKAIDNAFNQVIDIKNASANEYVFIESTILNKEFDDVTNKVLEDMIIPKNTITITKPATAFGLFLGYTINVPEADKLDNCEYQEFLKKKMMQDIMSVAPYIENKIKSLGLACFSFYIYVLPLNNAIDDKDKIMKQAMEV